MGLLALGACSKRAPKKSEPTAAAPVVDDALSHRALTPPADTAAAGGKCQDFDCLIEAAGACRVARHEATSELELFGVKQKLVQRFSIEGPQGDG